VADKAPLSTSASDGILCMQMRGGTSKGAYFLLQDLPSAAAERDDLLLDIMGSPDERQIDGIGGGHPLTSKVAVVSASSSPDADVDYLFLQVAVDKRLVTDAQTCGNLLAGVGPFALERGLVPAGDETTDVRIRVMNGTRSVVIATVATPDRRVSYRGDARINGVPFPAAPVVLSFPGPAATLFPTGHLRQTVAGYEVTCVHAGMPVVIVRADEIGIRGDESPTELENDRTLTTKVGAIRLKAGALMGLGDVSNSTIPKVTIISDASGGGLVGTRTFIPDRVHTSIGVMGAVSVAVACAIEGTVAFRSRIDEQVVQRIEHPTGYFGVSVALAGEGLDSQLVSSGVIRTARKLFDGLVFPRFED